MELVIIYTFISTLFYGDIVIGKHTFFVNMLTVTFVNILAIGFPTVL